MARISYAAGIPKLNDKWESVVSKLFDNAGIPNVQISSTYRDPISQASAMVTNVEKYGLQSQYDLYGSQMDKVLRDYEIKKYWKYGRSDTIKSMAATIKKLGITGGHLTQTDLYVTFDIPPNQIPESKLTAFTTEVKKIALKYIAPGGGEPVHHIELQGKPDVLLKMLDSKPLTPLTKEERKEARKKNKVELSNTTLLTKVDRIYEELGDGALQIGDLIFVVDPTQLAFNTQNGYQYFPTIRTQGNPKIPTMNQVKNISINLIFPNEDSINYQLLNLYAMFRRTPFVTIRNKDISAFFKDICFQDEWVSVALESIQIQSVNGFPNTLQASITILPFDYRMISDGFRALKSLRDVQRQQAVIYEDKETELLIAKSDAKLHSEDSVLDESSEANTTIEINKSPDFRDSLPFRAFYQSLIKGRHTILNEFGQPVPTTNGYFNIDNFAPTKDENYLHEYKAINNQEEIWLEYNYIPNDFRTVARLLSDERTTKQEQILKQLTTLADSLNTPNDVAGAMLTTFTTEADLYKIYGSKFDLEFTHSVDVIANRFGITLDNEDDTKPIKSVFGLVWQGFLNKTGYTKLSSTIKDINAWRKNQVSIDAPDYVGYLNGVTFDDGATFQTGMKKINTWLNSGPNTKEKKDKFAAFLTDLKQTIEKELGLIDTTEMLILDSNSPDGFKVGRLPIEKGRLSIDNKKDVITGWSLIFANKFVPITLQAFKYPYYQHVGSEDPTMSLSVTSTSEKPMDFKANLSELSERIYETVKIVTLTAPELITYLDSRLTVNAGENHIFNCFGIKKVIFESSNSVNIEGQPNSWNTTLNLTQANFTIAKYHGISQVPTNEIVKDEIAKLLIRMDRTQGNFEVFKYTDKDGKTLNLTFSQIIRIRFLKKYGGNLLKYINRLRDNSYQTKRKKIPDIRAASGYRYEFVEESKDLVGENLAQNLKNEIEKIINIKEVIDVDSSRAVQTLVIQNPIFKQLLGFLLNKTEELFKEKLKFFKTIIYEDPSWFKTFANKFGEQTKNLPANASLSLILAMFIPPSLIISQGLLAGSLIGATFESIAAAVTQEAKDKLISKFDNIFAALEDNISSSIALDFSDKVIRDPIIFDLLITKETIGEEAFNLITSLKTSDSVNCYGDFDLPNLPDMVIGPDFYLYNILVDSAKKQDYIREALKRYAHVGKLCAMMTLEETKDSLDKYEKIIDQANNVSQDITKVVSQIVTGSPDTTKENISELKKACYLQIEELASETIKYSPESKIIKTEKSQQLIENAARGDKYGNLDFRKLNLIKTARAAVMLDIFSVYLTLNSYMQENLNVKVNWSEKDQKDFEKHTKKKDYVGKNLTKEQSEVNSTNILYDILTDFFPNALKITQKSLLTSNSGLSDASQKALVKMFQNGMAEVSDAKFISLPGMQGVQNHLVNQIGYYIRLNSFLTEYATVGGDNALAPIDLTNLPELKFLDYWNFRESEANQRRLQITKTFSESYDSNRDTTIKLFPTFKLFFIEEDKNLVTHDFNDYYTQNAIQSIEIISNKNSPSTTAVVRLSNVTGALTDRMSLLREQEDLAGYSKEKKAKNLFFGSLDIKPGTQVIIKMGYTPFDNILNTVFQGRIIEMNAGPSVELICQSFGAQLNHQVLSEKFGLLSSVREHGDVASTTLDMIPGLEKLGKMSIYGDTGISTFSGKNIRNMAGKANDRFLLSNLLGSLSSMTFGVDNPRDENIYLNYSVSNSIYHHPTFDWVIYDQSVWEVLKEITLYHRGLITTLRPYNNNRLSTKNDLRETLVIGDKAGYFKDTDAFSLSTLNIKEIDEVCRKWNILNDSLDEELVTIDKVSETYLVGPTTSYRTVDIYKLTPNGKEIYEFLNNQLNALVLVAHLLKNNTNTASSLQGLDILLSGLDKNRFIPNSFDELVYNIINFSKSSKPENYDYNSFRKDTEDALVIKQFQYIIKGLKLSIGKGGKLDFNPEDYYNVKAQVLNTDEKLGNDPQYRKIQQHHLITDTSDIISNNITLNGTFSNVVNVYYTGEPKIKTASLDRLDDNYIQNKLKIWSIKAFGDQRDEFSRPLNSYQKNIDTNWFDTVEKTQNFFKTYKRVKGVDALKKINGINENQTNIPCWDLIPSFGVVAVNLLKQEVGKMYQGTIEIVGNPNIQPFDILHLQDYTNDMHGALEVEEVIHTFTPDRGFRTVITPNLITYDRDPIQMQDVHIINQIYDFANTVRTASTIGGVLLGTTCLGLAAGAAVGGGALGIVGAVTFGIGGLTGLYNGTVGSYVKQSKFLYDQMGRIMGRDCINFTSLLYHGMPYMAGFDGVDYTNLKTLMNHNVVNNPDPLTRYLSFGDTFMANITTGWDPKKYDLLKNWFGGIPVLSDAVIVPSEGLK